MLGFAQVNERALRVVAASLVAAFLSGAVSACGGSSGSSSTDVPTGPLRVTGGGVGRYRERGADNSIEEYGHEASRAELEQAATNVHAYLVAWVDKDFGVACSLSSKLLKQHLKGVFELSRKSPNQGFAQMLEAVARGEAPLADTPYEATEVDASSLRVEGRTGFLFFSSAGEGHQLEVLREGGTWRNKALLPSALH